MAMQAQVSNKELCPKFSELDRLCPIEVMLISQMILVMFIVPTDLKKIQTILPRSCNEEYMMSLALKYRLTDFTLL